MVNTEMPADHEEYLRDVMSDWDAARLLEVAIDGLKYAYGVDLLVLAGEGLGTDEWDDARSFNDIAVFVNEFAEVK